MKIAVLSGKGGAGKTFSAINLAAVQTTAIYADCDIEEPDGHLFFKPQISAHEDVLVYLPVIDHDRCTSCRKCVDFCRFSALGMINNRVIVFNDVCHACGGCTRVCPEHAITERPQKIGEVVIGQARQVRVISGVMDPGVESGVAIIKQVIKQLPHDDTIVFIDCPPGTGCATAEVIKECDYCLVVTEPTQFGAHDLEMVHELIKASHKPVAALINKAQAGHDPSAAYCENHAIPIIGKIDFNFELGRLNAEARVAAWENEQYHGLFSSLSEKLLREARHAPISHS